MIDAEFLPEFFGTLPPQKKTFSHGSIGNPIDVVSRQVGQGMAKVDLQTVRIDDRSASLLDEPLQSIERQIPPVVRGPPRGPENLLSEVVHRQVGPLGVSSSRRERLGYDDRWRGSKHFPKGLDQGFIAPE